MCITEKQILDIMQPEFEKLRQEFSDEILKSHNEMARLIHCPSPETLRKIKALEEGSITENQKIKENLERTDREKKEAIQRIEEKLEDHTNKEESVWKIIEEIKKMVALHQESIGNIDRALNGDKYTKKKGMIEQNDEMYVLLTKTQGAKMWMDTTKFISGYIINFILAIVAVYLFVSH
jgi:cytochrome c556